jgi:hypothetical protein
MANANKGKTPEHDRALELIGQGRTLVDAAAVTGIPTATIRRWAKKAGIPITDPTPAQKAELADRWKRTRGVRKAYEMNVTAAIMRRRAGGDP